MSEETYPQDLKYAEDHDWVRIEGDEAVFGISWFAQDALGEIVYAELPEVGAGVTAGSVYGELESVKAVTDVIAPLSGEVVAANDGLTDDPELLNRDCYGDGWLIRVRMSQPAEVEALMDVAAYTKFLEQA